MAKYVLIKDVLRACSETIVPSLVRKTAEMICVKCRQGSACIALMDGKGNFAIKVRDVSLNVWQRGEKNNNFFYLKLLSICHAVHQNRSIFYFNVATTVFISVPQPISSQPPSNYAVFIAIVFGVILMFLVVIIVALLYKVR